MVQLHGIHSRVLADMQIDTTTLIAKKVIFPSHYRANEYVIKVVHITGIPQEDLAVERNGVKRTPLHWVITFECKRIRPAHHSALPTKTIPSHSRRRCQSKRVKTDVHRLTSVTESVIAAVATININSSATNVAPIPSGANTESNVTHHFFRFDQTPPKENFNAYLAKKDSVPVELLYAPPSVYIFIHLPLSSVVWDTHLTCCYALTAS